MFFNSALFIAFFSLVAIIYYVFPEKSRWIWLLISSYIFYMSWNVKMVVVLITVTLATYIGGLLLSKNKENVRAKKTIVTLCILISIGILFLFKYYNFTAMVCNAISGRVGLEMSIPTFDIVMPIGISFFTFKSVGYIIDVYRNKVEAERNVFKYALFVSFFTELTAGPIDRSYNLLPQITEPRKFSYKGVRQGLVVFGLGMFEKIVVSDRLAILVDTVYNDSSSYKGFTIIVAMIFFAFQIYCDFASYSTMALGCSKILGFDVIDNFKSPYLSKNIREFWHYWHISLSTWFRDYLYFPLGGSRCSRLRKYFNLMVVFLVSGLWHGASLTFIIWGALHGAYQIISDLTKNLRTKVKAYLGINERTIGYRFWCISCVFVLVGFSWIFFRANSIHQAISVVKSIFYFNPWIFVDGSLFKLGLDVNNFMLAVFGVMLVIAADILKKYYIKVSDIILRQNAIFRWGIYIALVLFMLIFGIYGPAYDAQKFIYAQF